MVFFPVILFSLAFIGAKSEEPAAQTSHGDIIEKLDAVFGDENCVLDEETPILAAQNKARYACDVDVRGFSAVAEYYWKKEEDSTESPNYLAVSYAYANGNSGLEETTFENDICGLACFDTYFNTIVANTAYAGDDDALDTPNNSSSGPVAAPSQTPSTAAPTASPIVLPTKTPTKAPIVAPSRPTRTVSISDLVLSPRSPNLESSNTVDTQRSNSANIARYVGANIRRPNGLGRGFNI